MTYKQFRGWLKNWSNKAVSVRNESHELAKAAFELVEKDWNTNGLSDMVNELVAVRGFDTATFMKWVFFIADGDTGMTEQGLPVVDAEKSWLFWDASKKVFKVKEGAMIDSLEMKTKLQAWKWFDFCPKTVPNPYSITSLFAALKKAESNKAMLGQEEALFITRLVETAVDCGYAEKMEQ